MHQDDYYENLSENINLNEDNFNKNDINDFYPSNLNENLILNNSNIEENSNEIQSNELINSNPNQKKQIIITLDKNYKFEHKEITELEIDNPYVNRYKYGIDPYDMVNKIKEMYENVPIKFNQNKNVNNKELLISFCISYEGKNEIKNFMHNDKDIEKCRNIASQLFLKDLFKDKFKTFFELANNFTVEKRNPLRILGIEK